MTSTRRKLFTYGTMVFGFAIAGYLLYTGLSQFTWEEIVKSVRDIPTWNMTLALFYCALSYVCLTGFDWAGVRYVKSDLPYPKIALASFVSLGLGQSIGLAGLSSGAIRYRYYAHWGLSTEDVAKIVLMSGMTVGLGLLVLSGIVMVLNPSDTSEVLRIAPGAVLAIGIGCLLAAAAYVALAAFLRTPLKIKSWSFQMPRARLAVAQIVIGTANFAIVSACLMELMQATENVSYLKAATAYVLGNIAILITHAPGGLGVLEVTVRHVMGDQASIGALVAFRVIYFFIPFFIALPVSLIGEAVFRARKAQKARSAQDAQPAPGPSDGSEARAG
ncbi:YbhN family protein [Rhizobium sp. SSA_523]|uniref:lysylphosphatidylglycerol synthase transmembrane domain-containing protein n=1 Tax=Rhizobium sp. SSA_523 TaxID=2952477 RepID=UPI002090A862|nr:YbhN family protein [Rhizobium sp. SSA_523]MCO5733797.1 lysylphosphatidylglycerol synthase domain-containing protein [Rhizobium sp. SSA_523]WKC24928.1 YbhN family protein [Rhizobium sp. SSA_523]